MGDFTGGFISTTGGIVVDKKNAPEGVPACAIATSSVAPLDSSRGTYEQGFDPSMHWQVGKSYRYIGGRASVLVGVDDRAPMNFRCRGPPPRRFRKTHRTDGSRRSSQPQAAGVKILLFTKIWESFTATARKTLPSASLCFWPQIQSQNILPGWIEHVFCPEFSLMRSPDLVLVEHFQALNGLESI